MAEIRTKFKQVYQCSRDGTNSKRGVNTLLRYTIRRLYKELTKKYGIKFVCPRRKGK